MKKLLLMLVLACIVLGVRAKNDVSESKAWVDKMKSSIPYPKYNIDDTAYIAFVRHSNVTGQNVKERDIEVFQVKIKDAMLTNGSCFGNSHPAVTIFNAYYEFPLEWHYQYVETSIWEPRVGDYSKEYFEEARFHPTAKQAVEYLIQAIKGY